jgi:hypothetical protein
VLLLTIFAAYLPVIQGNYLYHDDNFLLRDGVGLFGKWPYHFYYLFSSVGNAAYDLSCKRGGACSEHPQYIAYTRHYGRPLGIYIKCFYASLICNQLDANFARCITLLAIWVLGMIICSQVATYLGSDALGVAVSICIITLPPFQTASAMIANATHIFAGILGLLAGKSALSFDRNPDAPWYVSLGLALFSLCLFLCGLLVYQPGAFLYMFPITLAFMKGQYPSASVTALRASKLLLPAIGGTIIYAIYLTLFISLDRGGLAFSVTQKAGWMFNEVIPHALAFWSLSQNWLGFLILLSLLLASLVARWMARLFGKPFFTENSSVTVLGLKVSMVAGISVASYLPNLIAAENVFVFRTLIAFQPVLLVIMIFLLKDVVAAVAQLRAVRKDVKFIDTISSDVVVCFLIPLAAIGVFTAHYNVMNYYVVPQSIELSYVRQKLSHVDFSNTKLIHIVRPKGSLLTGQCIKDEMGCMTTQNPQDIDFLVLGAMRQLGDKDTSMIRVTSGRTRNAYDFPGLDWPPSRDKPVDPGAFIIDMNGLCLKPFLR